MIDYIEKAKAFAMMAHKGQTDKAGEDYFTAHVAVVADGVEPDPLVKASAYLHDTVEDTGTTIDTIRAEFPQEVAEAVSVLTRKKDMTSERNERRQPKMLCKTVNAMSFAEYSYESEFESYESSFVSYTHRQAKTDLERLRCVF